MKITPVLLNSFQQGRNFENNQYDYSQYRVPVLSADCVNFTGNKKTPKPEYPFKIHYTRPFDDAKAGLITPSELPKREILEYSKYMLPCPCCGDLMMPPQLMDKIRASISGNASDTITLLKNFKNYMHPVEKQIYTILESSNKKHPNLDFHEILRKKYQRAERQLVLQQTAILSDIGLYGRDRLCEEHFNELSKIIEKTYQNILTKNNSKTFSRKTFIGELEAFAEKIISHSSEPKYKTNPYKNFLNKILETAYTLPTSYNSVHAFIVKYAKDKYTHRNIAERILSGSEATIEHALPQCLGGKTKFSNLINECARDNHARRHDDVIQQIREYPQMPLNMQKHFDKLINLSKQGKVDKSYITEIAMTYYKLSKGLIDIDVSGLWKHEKKVKEKNTKYLNVNNGTTPTKAERREARKLKIKRQKIKKQKFIIDAKHYANKKAVKNILRR